MKKILILISFLLILSGCTVNYNITIDEDNIKEDINVIDNITSTRTREDIISFYNSWYPVYMYDGIINDYSTKLDDAIYYNKSNLIDNGDNLIYTFSYNHKIDDYSKNTIWNLYLINNYLTNSSSKISIYSGKGMQLFNKSAITNLNINITTDLEVLEHNADKVSNNTYTWEYNLDNFRSKSVKLVLNKEEKQDEEESRPSTPNQNEEENKPTNENQNESQTENKKSNNLILILGILGLFFIVLIILLKIRRN